MSGCPAVTSLVPRNVPNTYTGLAIQEPKLGGGSHKNYVLSRIIVQCFCTRVRNRSPPQSLPFGSWPGTLSRFILNQLHHLLSPHAVAECSLSLFLLLQSCSIYSATMPVDSCLRRRRCGGVKLAPPTSETRVNTSGLPQPAANPHFPLPAPSDSSTLSYPHQSVHSPPNTFPTLTSALQPASPRCRFRDPLSLHKHAKPSP